MATDPQVFIDNIISNALTIANEASASVTAAANQILALVDGSNSTSLGGSLASLNISAIEPDIPMVGNVVSNYEALRDAWIAILTNKYANFFNTYYPLTTDAFDEATQKLVDMITNQGNGLNASIENQIWQRGRDRVITDGLRVENQILGSEAARGISRPAGAMSILLKQARFEQAANNGKASIDISIRQAELEIEQLNFAIENAIKCRNLGLSAAADYIRTIATAPEAAINATEIDPAVRAKMMGATADLYRARLQRDDLVMRTDIANMGNSLDRIKLLVDERYQSIEQKVRGTTAAANVLGQQSSAALASMNSVASTATNAFS